MFLITSRTFLNKVAAQGKKKAYIQKVLIRNPFLAMLDFFFGDLNISECPTKELIQCLQSRRRGTTI